MTSQVRSLLSFKFRDKYQLNILLFACLPEMVFMVLKRKSNLRMSGKVQYILTTNRATSRFKNLVKFCNLNV